MCRPYLAGLNTQAKVDVAQRVLHAMGLERCFALLVLLVGHGSQSTNNAQGAALDGGVLELLMTTPMLVTHWINRQYHPSTCDPLHLGSGNKLLHDVVGGRIGVFEGNGGALRIGLGRQSLRDGPRWVHEPVRLTVVIDAPAASIERLMASHTVVRQLVDNGWLHLWRFEEEGSARYDCCRWRKVET